MDHVDRSMTGTSIIRVAYDIEVLSEHNPFMALLESPRKNQEAFSKCALRVWKRSRCVRSNFLFKQSSPVARCAYTSL